MGPVLFVTGTDTGVGKTVAAAWLARHAAPSLKLALVKAAQTGADPLVDGDEAFYRHAVLAWRSVETSTLASLPDPLAPSIAARRAGKELDFERLAGECRRISHEHDLTIIEGSGGLLVTITGKADFGDLAMRLRAPLAVVLRPGLGTLNHTLLTMEAAVSRKLEVRMLICSGVASDPPVVERENLVFLRDRFPDIPLLCLEHVREESLRRLDLRACLLGVPPDMLRHVQFEGIPGLEGL